MQQTALTVDHPRLGSHQHATLSERGTRLRDDEAIALARRTLLDSPA
jgi:hypothetical protein